MGRVGIAVAAVAAVMGTWSTAAWAQADDVAVKHAAAPPPAWMGKPPPDDEERRLNHGTALTLGARKLELGILAFEYGITDWLVVGISPPFFALRAFSSILVPNGHVKLVALRRSGLWVAGNIAVYYASLTKSDNSASGEVLVVPLSLFVSYKVLPRFWVHPEATYTHMNIWGSGDVSRLTFEGAAPTRTFQLGLQLQYQINKVFALTLAGRLQAYTGTVPFDGTGTSADGMTTATVQGTLTPQDLHPWSVVPGVAFLWKHWRLSLGAGYGNYFLPGMDVSVRGAGFVPQGSIAFVL